MRHWYRYRTSDSNRTLQMQRRPAPAPAPVAANAASFGPLAASGAMRSTHGHCRGESYAFAAKPNAVCDLPAVAAVHERSAPALARHSRGQVPLAPVALESARLLSPPYAPRSAVDRLHTNHAISSRPRLRPDPGHDRVTADEALRNRLHEHVGRGRGGEQKPDDKAEECTPDKHRATLRRVGAIGQGRSPAGRPRPTRHCCSARSAKRRGSVNANLWLTASTSVSDALLAAPLKVVRRPRRPKDGLRPNPSCSLDAIPCTPGTGARHVESSRPASTSCAEWQVLCALTVGRRNGPWYTASLLTYRCMALRP
jgi:hypothetical protein